MQLIELRNYLLAPGKTGAFIRYFEEHFLQSQRDQGMYPIGQFELTGEPDRVPVRCGNLPAPLNSFVGREAEIAEVARLLEASRLVTLTGPGGTGKTSLAIRAATHQVDRFRDGVFFVDLSAAIDSDSVLVAMARVLRLGEVIDLPLMDELVDGLRGRQTLLVLDNFEQVTEAAPIATRLLSECPKVRLLVTSREPLHVRAEEVYQVPPLGLPPDGGRVAAAEVASYEAVELFVERARAARA
jgi:non-specific serine/threonine protein kinase